MTTGPVTGPVTGATFTTAKKPYEIYSLQARAAPFGSQFDPALQRADGPLLGYKRGFG